MVEHPFGSIVCVELERYFGGNGTLSRLFPFGELKTILSGAGGRVLQGQRDVKERSTPANRLQRYHCYTAGGWQAHGIRGEFNFTSSIALCDPNDYTAVGELLDDVSLLPHPIQMK